MYPVGIEGESPTENFFAVFSPANSRRKYGETTPFPRCDFFGYFRRDLAAISPRVLLPFPPCGFRGYFCGDFTAVFLTFFAMRF